jgi:hypothetical protein
LSDTDKTAAPAKGGRLRVEIIIAAVCLLFGMLVLPALVYWVGTTILGPYTEGGLAGFYSDLFRDLLAGTGRAWLLVAGPYVTLMLLRLVLLGFRGGRHTERAGGVDA